MLEVAKRKVVFFWLTHSYLRRIAKRYPEYFEHWINDLTDNYNARKVMKSADIIKDLTKSFKNLVEVEHIVSESGIEKY